MKEKKVSILDEKDDKICDVLQQLGMKPGVARVLLYFMHNRIGMSREIEKAVDLRQPEVSVAICELRKMKLIKLTLMPAKGKGRPVHKYEFSVSNAQIVKMVHEMTMQKIKVMQDNLKKLDELVSAMKE